jgi:hypothetical protein
VIFKSPIAEDFMDVNIQSPLIVFLDSLTILEDPQAKKQKVISMSAIFFIVLSIISNQNYSNNKGYIISKA